jgi:ribosome biogenesis protein MAK21
MEIYRAAYCGADLTLYYELIQLSKHFHPTVQLFVEDILKSKNIKYYGDPLKDFSVSHFLDRFSFKNPKKVDKKQESSFKPIYQAKGSRGLSVHNLTEQNCTEEEKFIFE